VAPLTPKRASTMANGAVYWYVMGELLRCQPSEIANTSCHSRAVSSRRKSTTVTVTVKSRMRAKLLCFHVLSLLFILKQLELMVTTSCNAPGCFWEKGTYEASRGLSRHRATCQHYQKSRSLASQKRRERAKQAARFIPSLPTTKPGSSSLVSSLFPLQCQTVLTTQFSHTSRNYRPSGAWRISAPNPLFHANRQATIVGLRLASCFLAQPRRPRVLDAWTTLRTSVSSLILIIILNACLMMLWVCPRV
jgi:hypothetical protein